jgi:hypothetical protein
MPMASRILRMVRLAASLSLQADLPFKLNSKHFRRLGPGKSGYGQWKLDKEIQNKVEDCLAGR